MGRGWEKGERKKTKLVHLHTHASDAYVGICHLWAWWMGEMSHPRKHATYLPSEEKKFRALEDNLDCFVM
jgi:hypothetical protein